MTDKLGTRYALWPGLQFGNRHWSAFAAQSARFERMSIFHKGQRWISEPEPELGLGTVLKVEDGRVQIVYPATNELRVYTMENAPLRRVNFRTGETIACVEHRRSARMTPYFPGRQF